MSTDKSLPLYSLTVKEFVELNRQIISEEVRSQLCKQAEPESARTTSDLIFIDEMVSLTGYSPATIYSKVSRNEIPVISRGRPLTFSRSVITRWIGMGKPTVHEMEADKVLHDQIYKRHEKRTS